MAAAFIDMDRQTEVGRQIARALQLLREGQETLSHARAVIIQMRDGDGSQAVHYDLVAAEVGYQAGDFADANAAARASFLELDSLHAKITAGDGVGDATGAAIAQACAKHGI